MKAACGLRRKERREGGKEERQEARERVEEGDWG